MKNSCSWKVCMEKFHKKIPVRPFTIGYTCKELQSICCDYDGGMAHILNMQFFAEARIFPSFDGS